MKLNAHGLGIGQIAERTGLAVSAIRFYEDQGLVHPHRNAGGQRRFERADIRRLSFVMIAQRLGFTLAEIRAQFAALPEGRTPTKADWSKISHRFGAELDARIEGLTVLRARLDKCIGCGCLSLKQCHLYNREDIASGKGQGPRYLMGDTPEDT
ncbi:MAG: redox-sensitive transcriptional activator SoxR [Paracoccaceae bacterium]